MALTDKWEESTVPVTDIANDVANAIEFRRARGQSVPNSRLLSEVIEESLNRFQRDHLVKTTARSRRRRAALVQVARTLADLRGALTITNDDIEQARVLTVHTHRMMEDVSD
jgi:Mg-chelatase subunit ChlI